MKICNKCKQEKDEKEFYHTKRGKNGLHSWCKLCANNHNKQWKKENQYYIKHNNSEWKKNNPEKYKNVQKKSGLKCLYGISEERYNSILLEQNNRCLICGVDFNKLKHSPYVDHNHQTGKIRGLLCFSCNIALGHFHDNLTILYSAVKYLERDI